MLFVCKGEPVCPCEFGSPRGSAYRRLLLDGAGQRHEAGQRCRGDLICGSRWSDEACLVRFLKQSGQALTGVGGAGIVGPKFGERLPYLMAVHS